MSALGEIARLVRTARPAAGIITMIGVSHLENLGSRENILKAKLEICQGLPDGAPLVLNGDDAMLRGASPAGAPAPGLVRHRRCRRRCARRRDPRCGRRHRVHARRCGTWPFLRSRSPPSGCTRYATRWPPMPQPPAWGWTLPAPPRRWPATRPPACARMWRSMAALPSLKTATTQARTACARRWISWPAARLARAAAALPCWAICSSWGTPARPPTARPAPGRPMRRTC